LKRAWYCFAALPITQPSIRRQVVAEVCKTIVVSERRVCWAVEKPRSSQRYVPQMPEVDKPLIEQVVKLAEKYGRYGFRRITALLQKKPPARAWRSPKGEWYQGHGVSPQYVISDDPSTDSDELLQKAEELLIAK